MHGGELMRQLDRVLRAERTGEGSLRRCSAWPFRPSRRLGRRRSHPGDPCRTSGMLLHGGGTVHWLERGRAGAGAELGNWCQHEVELPVATGYCCSPTGSSRVSGTVGTAGRAWAAVAGRSHAGLSGPAFVDALIDGAQQRAQSLGGLTDDIAVLRVERTPA
ncbi:hypothetical protein I551_4114 [Mycobacterium ulcerans str. Harvey]|uniref:Stage II sporulation E family protein n=1 Tax=Mycobacterium ulcerans str. Harvey TaxID=1299332 RepID=A0ABP3AEM5_MYCUL|nr:hypothetical protein I551_4114 [Mycobacterium ulcerans str. Harvey]